MRETSVTSLKYRLSMQYSHDAHSSVHSHSMRAGMQERPPVLEPHSRFAGASVLIAECKSFAAELGHECRMGVLSQAQENASGRCRVTRAPALQNDQVKHFGYASEERGAEHKLDTVSRTMLRLQ